MSLDDKMTELADAIRSKTGKTGKLSIPQMVGALTSSETVYWNGDLLTNRTQLLAKPIPAHTKISDIIVTSDKLTDTSGNSISNSIFLVFKDQAKVDTAMCSYHDGGRWTFYITKQGNHISETELPDDLIGINTFFKEINNLKIVVKDTDSSELPAYTTVFQAYTGLANAIRKNTGTSGKLTIEKMITLLGGTTSKDDTPTTPSQPSAPSQPVTVFENLQISTFGGSLYDFTSPVPLGDTRLEVTLQVVNSGTGSVTISIPGTSISKTIASGGRGYQNVTATLDIPSGMANSIKAIEVDVGHRNALKQLTVVAK